jgi:WD40 repeat protein
MKTNPLTCCCTGHPKLLKFKSDSKFDTDLYDFVKGGAKAIAVPWGINFSPNGQLFATLASDRKVRVFSVATGKLYVQRQSRLVAHLPFIPTPNAFAVRLHRIFSALMAIVDRCRAVH